MKPVVVISNWVHPEVIAYLERWFLVVPNFEREPLSRMELIGRAAKADAIMVFMPDSIDDSFLAACPSLRIVGAALKGYDNFDVEACTRRGIWFTIVPDLLTVPTAELTIGLMIGVGRAMAAGDDYLRTGQFQGWRPKFYGTGISGKRVGIIGMGAVGQAVAERLAAFQADVIYYDQHRLEPQRENVLRVQAAGFEELIRTSDYVVPLVPLNENTHHMINENVIGMMRKDAYLVNAGRGSVVDEAAVAEALLLERIEGYAADVFEMEDWARIDRPKQIPSPLLWDRSRTFFTPHLGSAVNDVRKAIALEAARNIVQVFQGEQPDGRVNTPDTIAVAAFRQQCAAR